MRIVFLNAWGGAVFEELAAWLPTVGSNIICLQEVTRTPGLTGWTRFDDTERALPQRANLFDDLTALLPRHNGNFVASDAGPVEAEPVGSGEGNRHRQDFGLAVFVDERLPVVGQEAAFVHGRFVDHDEWAIADRPRIAQIVRVVDREAERTITIGQLHGLREPAGKADTPARLAQAERLAALLERVRQPEDLVVVGGDFNLLPDSETFDVLGEIGLVDLVGEADTRTALYEKPVRNANYLLVSDPDQVKRFETPDTPIVSDHRPLILDLE